MSGGDPNLKALLDALTQWFPHEGCSGSRMSGGDPNLKALLDALTQWFPHERG